MLKGYWNDCLSGDGIKNFNEELLTEDKIKENIKNNKIKLLKKNILDNLKELNEISEIEYVFKRLIIKEL